MDMAQQLRSAPLDIKPLNQNAAPEKVISSKSIDRQQHSRRPMTLLNRRCRFVLET